MLPKMVSSTTILISNNDITGGVPVALSSMVRATIGLAFDGNWEAASGDIEFEPVL